MIILKFIKYLFFGIFIVVSFYLTEKIMIYLENQNPIMKEIIKLENSYEVKSVNAIIEDNTIIPGINGKKINKKKSLLKMENFGSFNETFIIYNDIKPDISINDNIDKVIIKGNNIKRNISLILEDSDLTNYLKEHNIQYSLISDLSSDLTIDREYILGETDKKNISDLNTLLNKKKKNSKICLINYSNLEYCKEKKYYLIKPNIDTINNINYLLNDISSGSIILVRKSTSLDNLKLIIKEIKKQDLDIVYLSTLISE